MPTALVATAVTTSGAVPRGQQITTALVPVNSDAKLTVTDIVLPDPYVSGGVQLTAANLGLTTLYAILSVTGFLPDSGLYRFQLDATTKTKIVVALDDGTSGVPAESAAVSLTGVKVRVVAIGA